MENVKNKKHSKKKFFRYLSLILFVVTLINLGLLFFLNVMPFIYFSILAGILLVFDIFLSCLLLGKGWKKRLFGTILSFIKLILMLFIFVYCFHTIDFLHKIQGGNYNTENYSILVLKESQYDKLKELKDKTVGIIKLGDDYGLEEAKKQLNKKGHFNYQENDDLTTLLSQLLEREVDAILVENAEKSILEEEHPEILEVEKVIYTFSVDIEIKDDLVKDVNIMKKPFNIFISGIDSYGKISSVSRSDVNMVVTINPMTHKILLTSIPRDYYVKLHGINTTYKDKITHAGMHGINSSVKTVEDLFGIDINYYAKVNFTSLVNLVDELGGIDVDVDETFRAYYVEDKVVDYTFKKGMNHLNGKQALAFARERKSLALGDVARVKHQQMVLEGIVNKVLTKNIITKYNDLLNALEGKFVTNLGTQNITKLVKQQIKNNASWELEKNTLKGTNGSEYTYSYKSKKMYVMIPDEDSLTEAKEQIKRIMEG